MRGKWKRIKRVSVALFLAVTITFGVVGDTTKVLAQTEPTFDQGFFSSNDIFFYDPTYQAVCAGGGLVGGSTKEKIWNFFIANDLSPEQAAGIMGNMEEESRFSPTVQQDRGANLWDSEYNKAWGLVQWDGGRRFSAPDGGILGTLRKEKSNLVKYLGQEFGGFDQTEPSESFPEADYNEMLLFQLDYLMQESMSRDHRSGEGFDGSSDNEWERLKEQSTARKAAIYWHWAFERSNDSPSQITERLDAAEAILAEFGKDLSAAGSGTASCAPVSGLQELTLQYAWPQRIKPDDDPNGAATPTDAYEQAIDNTDGYVGGCVSVNGTRYCGIDCGAFVTRLVIDSGYDPEYNYSGDGGPTGVQEQWLVENWEELGKAGSFNTADLRPGDVAMVTSEDRNHTFIFVGEISGFGGNDSTPGVASASIGNDDSSPHSWDSWRAPMAGGESLDDSAFTWYRRR